MADTGYQRLKRYRERKRQRNAPVPRYCKAVIAWDERVATPASGRLALLASDILAQWETRAPGKRSLADAMGIGGGRLVLTEASKVAQRGLDRALAQIAAETVTEVSIRAGLHHAKRLVTAPRTVSNSTALFHAMLGRSGGYAPAHLAGPLSSEAKVGDLSDTNDH